jgi:hypothetical protein
MSTCYVETDRRITACYNKPDGSIDQVLLMPEQINEVPDDILAMLKERKPFAEYYDAGILKDLPSGEASEIVDSKGFRYPKRTPLQAAAETFTAYSDAELAVMAATAAEDGEPAPLPTPKRGGRGKE